MVFRVYVEKKPGFDVEAQQLTNELRTILGIRTLKGVRLVNRYDVEGIDEQLFEQVVPTVFSEPQSDNVSFDLPDFGENAVFAVEYLPGQFDQRADSASECIQLISQGERPTVRTATVYALDGALNTPDVDAVKHYVIGFDVEAQQLTNELRTILGIRTLKGVRLVNRYDVEGIDEQLFEQVVPTVFSEPQSDNVSFDLPDFGENAVFAVEYLPGQFDQRADSASECIQLISQGERPTVRTATVYALDGALNTPDVDAVKHYVINPVEAREAGLETKDTLTAQVPTPGKVEVIDGFRAMETEQMERFIADRGLAMDVADLEFCRQYFEEEGRDPTITEIRVIDTYWSDHCRHTTFGTQLDSVTIDDAVVQAAFERYLAMRDELGRSDRPVTLMDMGTIGAKWLKANGVMTGLDESEETAFERYLAMRDELGRSDRPVTLMDMGTIGAKWLKANGVMTGLDESEEINACTVKVKVDVNGEDEDWLFLFKNETHNHPTEIEPFGGAATCIGGCIRDPLSGRAYVYQAGKLDDLEVSEENNACSIFVDVDVDGQPEKWLLQFKNETHNHPTEIEPFGGASTCLGGAIRDPLSGRSYVYQAMRVTGAGDIYQPVGETLAGKLPQRVISRKAAAGYSSYGNQIGLATTHVREIYHPDYVAKRLEVGAVVGAVKAENVRRETPAAGDVVLLLGGRTGRDGIGGATGSSKEHNTKSLETCSSEVQKGNAPEERKLERLFRRPEVTRLIKKSNDFGAGGVSVAIGELTDGLDIYLDRVPTKYDGLNATELAISESQERMAVVVERADMERFMDYCREENIEVTHVADVTDTRRMRMYNRDRLVVDLSREFIDSAGAAHYAEAEIGAVEACDPFVRKPQGATLAERMEADLADDNVVSQKGLVEMFDSTIGASTVLLPFGGRTQGSETQVSVQKLPVDGYTETASIMAYGYNPFLTSWSPYHGAAYAVVEACAKAVAAGAEFGGMRFSYQEYFERMHTARSWGKPLAALLGALRMQVELGLPSIGGKDQGLDERHLPADQRAAHAHGLRHYDRRRAARDLDRSERGGAYALPAQTYAEGEPYARYRGAPNLVELCFRADRRRSDRGGLCRRVRRCGRGAGEDGFRQRNRRGGRVAGGGAVRLRLRFDRGGEHRRTRCALRRAAGPDDGRRSVDC